MQFTVVSLIVLNLLLFQARAQDPLDAQNETYPDSSGNCVYRNDPLEYELRAARARQSAYDVTLKFSRVRGLRSAEKAAVAPGAIPRRNVIDDQILDRLIAEGVPAAPLSSDEEFLRRVTLDLTGRLPSSAEVRAFLADSRSNKRDVVIEQLVNSDGFVEKWTLWLGDLLQNAALAANRSQQITGRNRMHEWIRDAVAGGRSLREIFVESVTQSGNNFDATSAGANFTVRGFAPMGPAQDTYDMMLVRSATTWLGLGHYDCLLCHDGAGHLNSVTAWGTAQKRLEAQRMAAFFSRARMQSYRTDNQQDPYFNSFIVSEQTTGTYQLNTNSGNRPARLPNGTTTNLTPVYRDGRAAASGSWRASFANLAVEDPMFARNLANRLWKAMFNVALAEPVDNLDPARLDPNVAPPQGWGYQASHPRLLEELAQFLRDSDYQIRPILWLMAQSSIYQLSSRYDAEWDLTKASLFARRIPRRLDGEEVHDAVLKATGVPVAQGGYAIQGWTARAERAMQLPEPAEPRAREGQSARAFMDSFQRGNRDTVQRSQSSSILMMLQLMNSDFVNGRLRTSLSPFLQELVRNGDNDAVIDEMFLSVLSRRPSDAERETARAALQKAATRADGVQDLAWALMNKVDFLFSY